MPESTSYLEGGLDVFNTPADGQVPKWVAARNRAEWGDDNSGSGLPVYACQAQRHANSDLVVPTATETEIPYSGLYFENVNGVGWPGVMWNITSPGKLVAPIEGLYSFAGSYVYESLPADTYYRTTVRINGSTVAAIEEGNHAVPTGATTFAECSIAGLAYLAANDTLDMFAYHEAGANKSIRDNSAFFTGGATRGPIFGMNLVAPRGS